jgi:pullulanase
LQQPVLQVIRKYSEQSREEKRSETMITVERMYHAYLDELNIIAVLLPRFYYNGSCSGFALSGRNGKMELIIKERQELEEAIKYICTFEGEVDLGTTSWIHDEYGGKTDLQMGSVIRTEAFDDKYYYSGDLGCFYTEGQTVFKLWAPTATRAKVAIEEPGKGEREHPMERGDRGVWSFCAEGNLELHAYTYKVCIDLEWREAADPYAAALTANGEKGVIASPGKVEMAEHELPPIEHDTDAIIYETHIRDFTIHPLSGADKKGTYRGAAELGTKGPGGCSTGLSYVKELGATHIEFLPFHDFAGVDELGEKSDYNWGYNPLHFNAPDGSYSEDPTDPYLRIRELKDLISAVHSQGLRVIMDAVYNHVYVRETSSFEKLVPGYFFRHDEFGMPSNGTGVGNDFASERKMAGKFIVDSVRFWLREYKIDGLRFDLMGILDVETMKRVRKAADETGRHILVIGEGWDLNTPLPQEQKANLRNQARLERIGQFNDWFRDSIKGSTFNIYDKGYALGNAHYREDAKQVLAGSIGMGKKAKPLFHSPGQSVNYAESHDNHTLWDKLGACFPEEADEFKEKHHRLATAMVILAQGIPFLHSGQEFFRTKKGDGNSYRSPNEINWLDWERRLHYKDNAEYIKGLIEIRKKIKAFRFHSTELIRKHMQFIQSEEPMIAFELQGVREFGGYDAIRVWFNPSREEKMVSADGEWAVIADGDTAGAEPVNTVNSGSAAVAPCSLLILAKG